MQNSKASRWAARAAAAAASAPPTSVDGASTPSTSTTKDALDGGATPLDVFDAPTLVQGQSSGGAWPAPEVAAKGSALEAWLARAAGRDLHRPWHGKRRDYADEKHKLAKSGLSAAQIRRQRQHLNPPELARRYSTIQESDEESPLWPCGMTLVAGLGWARSTLDSKAAWRPNTPDIRQWMEMDLGEETEVIGIVTQGEYAIGCGGICGVCSDKCPKTRKCNGGGGQNYVSRICVKYRRDATEPWARLPEDLEIGQGQGEGRRETLLPSPVSARYVRLHPVDFHGCVAMRAGVLVGPRHHLFDSSPFALPAPEAQSTPSHAPSSSAHSISTQASAVPQTLPMSKAARWASRAKQACGGGIDDGAGASASVAGKGERSGGQPCRVDAGQPCRSPRPQPVTVSSLGEKDKAQGAPSEGVMRRGEDAHAEQGGQAAHTPSTRPIPATQASGGKSESLHSSPSLMVLQERLKSKMQAQLPSLVHQLQAWQLPLKVPMQVAMPMPPSSTQEKRVVVWRVEAEVPFVVCCDVGGGDYPLILQMQHTQSGSELMACSKLRGEYSETASTAQYAGKASNVTLTVSVNEDGYHIAVAPQRTASLFYAHSTHGAAVGVSALLRVPLTQFVRPDAPQPIPKVDICRRGNDEAVLWRRAYELRSDDWTLVFRQTAPFTFSDDEEWSNARMLNAGDARADNYSILGQLEQFRCADGLFSFMLRYPQLDDGKCNIWRQRFPLAASECACLLPPASCLVGA